MVFEDGKLLAWIADGYKHKLFASDAKKESVGDIRPCETDNFALLPEDQVETYAGIRVITPEPLNDQRRVQSATLFRNYDAPKRPGTAPAKYRSPYAQRTPNSRASTPAGNRPTSAKSVISNAGSGKLSPKTVHEMRKGFTLVNKLYERQYNRYRINLHPAGPDPDFRYFDRHARCYGYTHMHSPLLPDEPQEACSEHPCDDASRPVSAMSSVSRHSHRYNDPESMDQPQRYINYVRPKSSPLTVSIVGILII